MLKLNPVTGALDLIDNTIENNSVTDAKLADMPVNTIKGRIAAGTGDPENLISSQVTSMLDPFTAVAQGVVPASGGGTLNFLRADGTWSTIIIPQVPVVLAILEFLTIENISIRNGQTFMYLPSSLNGWRVQEIKVTVATIGTSTFTVTLRIGATNVVIPIATNTLITTISNATGLVTDDLIRVDVISLGAGTPPKGLTVTLDLIKP